MYYKRYGRQQGNFDHLLTGSNIFIALVSIILSGIASFSIDSCSRDRAGTVRLNFSEYSQIEEDYRKANEDIDPLTTYLCLTNDATMKVFEAWAIANKRSPYNMDSAFATELEVITVRELKQNKRNFTDLTDRGSILMTSAYAVMDKTRPLDPALAHIRGIEVRLNRIWKMDKTEHTRTEFYTETECSTDSKGNRSCTTVTKSRQVCDYYEWEYWYNEHAARDSSAWLQAFIDRGDVVVPPIEFNLRPASQTNAENEWANEWTAIKTKTDRLVNTREWIDTSSFIANLSAYRIRVGMFEQNKRDIESTYGSQPYYNVHTSCWGSFEPAGYVTTNNVVSNVSTAHTHASAVLHIIRTTPAELTKLKSMIDDYIRIKLDGGKGDIESEDVISQAEKVYNLNFTNSRHFHYHRAWISILLFIIFVPVFFIVIATGYAAVKDSK